jgi:hypothetical protein
VSVRVLPQPFFRLQKIHSLNASRPEAKIRDGWICTAAAAGVIVSSAQSIQPLISPVRSLSLLSLPLTLFQPLNSCIIFNQQNAVSPSAAWAFPN